MNKLYYPFMRDFEITSEYGPRGNGFHNGIDFAIPEFTDLLAVADWELAHESIDKDGYGYYVVLDHKQLGISTLYAHLWGVTNGYVNGKALDRIAPSGNSGNSSGPHLHFEVRNTLYKAGYWDKHDNGQFKNSVDPKLYLPTVWHQKTFLHYKDKYNLDDNHKPEQPFTLVETIAVMERVIKKAKINI